VRVVILLSALLTETHRTEKFWANCTGAAASKERKPKSFFFCLPSTTKLQQAKKLSKRNKIK
jgi:hypothetical protein